MPFYCLPFLCLDWFPWQHTSTCMTSGAVQIRVFFGLLSIAWLAKHMEWNAIWNMGVVISVLEEKQGVSAYVCRGCRHRGLFLMLMFFVWRLTRYIFNCLISESLFKFEQTKISLLRESYALLFSGHTDLEHRSPCAFLGFPRNPQRSKTTP